MGKNNNKKIISESLKLAIIKALKDTIASLDKHPKKIGAKTERTTTTTSEKEGLDDDDDDDDEGEGEGEEESNQTKRRRLNRVLQNITTTTATTTSLNPLLFLLLPGELVILIVSYLPMEHFLKAYLNIKDVTTAVNNSLRFSVKKMLMNAHGMSENLVDKVLIAGTKNEVILFITNLSDTLIYARTLTDNDDHMANSLLKMSLAMDHDVLEDFKKFSVEYKIFSNEETWFAKRGFLKIFLIKNHPGYPEYESLIFSLDAFHSYRARITLLFNEHPYWIKSEFLNFVDWLGIRWRRTQGVEGNILSFTMAQMFIFFGQSKLLKYVFEANPDEKNNNFLYQQGLWHMLDIIKFIFDNRTRNFNIGRIDIANVIDYLLQQFGDSEENIISMTTGKVFESVVEMAFITNSPKLLEIFQNHRKLFDREYVVDSNSYFTEFYYNIYQKPEIFDHLNTKYAYYTRESLLLNNFEQLKLVLEKPMHLLVLQKIFEMIPDDEEIRTVLMRDNDWVSVFAFASSSAIYFLIKWFQMTREMVIEDNFDILQRMQFSESAEFDSHKNNIMIIISEFLITDIDFKEWLREDVDLAESIRDGTMENPFPNSSILISFLTREVLQKIESTISSRKFIKVIDLSNAKILNTEKI